MTSTAKTSHGQTNIVEFIAALGLLFSWAVLFFVGEVVTWSLAPYDTAPLEQRAPQGMWQRDVSDFFQSPPGSEILSNLIVGGSVLLFVVAFRRAMHSPPQRLRLVLAFALSNLGIIAAMFWMLSLTVDLPLHLAPYPGYGWTIKFLIPEIVLLAVLFVLQARVIPRRLLSQR